MGTLGNKPEVTKNWTVGRPGNKASWIMSNSTFSKAVRQDTKWRVFEAMHSGHFPKLVFSWAKRLSD